MTVQTDWLVFNAWVCWFGLINVHLLRCDKYCSTSARIDTQGEIGVGS